MSSEAEETKVRILKAALALLESQSDTEVRMSDIAKKANVSRQAVYLHFKNRANLLTQATYYQDEILGVEAKLAVIRSSKTGTDRLNAFVSAWTNYIPEIYGVAKALMKMSSTDKEAAEAWNKRMDDVKKACAVIIQTLHKEKKLSKDYSPSEATDLLWTLLSVRNWEHLTIDCKFSQKKYSNTLLNLVNDLFVE